MIREKIRDQKTLRKFSTVLHVYSFLHVFFLSFLHFKIKNLISPLDSVFPQYIETIPKTLGPGYHSFLK